MLMFSDTFRVFGFASIWEELQRKDVGCSFVWPRGHVCICLSLCTSCTFHREGFPLFVFWNQLLKLKSVPCSASSSSSLTYTDTQVTPSRPRLYKSTKLTQPKSGNFQCTTHATHTFKLKFKGVNPQLASTAGTYLAKQIL
jgi:hypothetical protein